MFVFQFKYTIMIFIWGKENMGYFNKMIYVYVNYKLKFL